ncbi:ABC transporter permease [Frondihabitans sp. PAMC 28766]|nr:ABC transporter permease [Frondihabitans sp. PAMC 28766]
MNFVGSALQYIFTPGNWASTVANPIGARLGEHLWYTLLSLAIATVIAMPIGLLIGHTGRGRQVAVLVSGGARALPTLGVITLLAVIIGVGLRAPLISFVILAIPSILAGAYSGLEAVDRQTVDAARAMGMTEWQILTQVEVPLGLPLIIGGLRSATLQIVATATLANYVGALGLGSFIFLGLGNNDYTTMLVGAILVVALAIAFEIVYSVVQRLVIPAGVRAGRTQNVRSRSARSRTVVGSPLQEGNES